MIASMSLGQLIRATNPQKPIIDLAEYKVDPSDFEDRPIESDGTDDTKRGRRWPRTEPKQAPAILAKAFMDQIPLTSRQIQVARLYAVGHTQTQIAAECGLTPGCVASKLARIRKRLKCESREAVAAVLKKYKISLSKPPEKLMVSPLACAVMDALDSEGPALFNVPVGKSYKVVEKWCHTYAKRMGGQISCRHINGVIWIFRREA